MVLRGHPCTAAPSSPMSGWVHRARPRGDAPPRRRRPRRRRSTSRPTASRTSPRRRSASSGCSSWAGSATSRSFDPKPALDKYAGKTIDESPFKKAVVESPYYRKNVMDFAGTPRALHEQALPARRSASRSTARAASRSATGGRTSAACVDDIAVVRSMWTTDNDHAAQLQFHTGRHVFEGFHPTVGSWVHYGLGALSRQPAAVRGARQPAGRLLRRGRRARGELPRPGARRRAADRRPGEPAAVRHARATPSRRRAARSSSTCSAT